MTTPIPRIYAFTWVFCKFLLRRYATFSTQTSYCSGIIKPFVTPKCLWQPVETLVFTPTSTTFHSNLSRNVALTCESVIYPYIVVIAEEILWTDRLGNSFKLKYLIESVFILLDSVHHQNQCFSVHQGWS